MSAYTNECITNELDLFSKPLSQDEIVDSKLIEYTPISSLDKLNRINFNIQGSGDYFVKLNSSHFIVRLKVNKKDNTDFTDADVFYPANNLFHSIFNKVEVSLNDKPILSEASNYAYRAYIQTLLNFNTDEQENLLTSSLWQRDTRGKFDSVAKEN